MKVLEEEIGTKSSGQHFYGDYKGRVEDFARHEPAKAVGAAAGVGLLLPLLPLGFILRGLFRGSFALLKPALLCFGAYKLYQEFSRRSSSGSFRM